MSESELPRPRSDKPASTPTEALAAAVDEEEARVRRLEAELANARGRAAALRADLANVDASIDVDATAKRALETA